ncbi:barstar family protein [Lachnospiraceae bacterium OttesenSCG-928-D06]|nr:barstar family protein [Lachnospiraceae bacterium OttesenSCG-928-D06]
MKNNIVYISSVDVTDIKKKAIDDNETFYVEIDGKKLLNLSDYLDEISDLFNFPRLAKNLDGYNDWMTDFTWMSLKKIVFIINNYEDFMSKDLLAKNKIIANFSDLILPWWEKEVIDHMVGGEAKSFMVYLVN